MNSVRIADFAGHEGQEITLRGWLHNKRSSGKLQFLIVRDGSGFAQAVVAKAAVPAEAWEAAEKAGQESAAERVVAIEVTSKDPLTSGALANLNFGVTPKSR